MQYFWLYFFAGLLVLAGLAIGIAGLRLSQSAKRVARSYAPIGVKVRGLSIEVSALKRSRLDRQRRLDTSSSDVIDSEE